MVLALSAEAKSHLQISRVTKVVKGGKQISFRAVVAVGDGQGSVRIPSVLIPCACFRACMAIIAGPFCSIQCLPVLNSSLFVLSGLYLRGFKVASIITGGGGHSLSQRDCLWCQKGNDRCTKQHDQYTLDSGLLVPA